MLEGRPVLQADIWTESFPTSLARISLLVLRLVIPQLEHLPYGCHGDEQFVGMMGHGDISSGSDLNRNVIWLYVAR
jgi:hypothetical protein